jgi:hypothetical protein
MTLKCEKASSLWDSINIDYDIQDFLSQYDYTWGGDKTESTLVSSNRFFEDLKAFLKSDEHENHDSNIFIIDEFHSAMILWETHLIDIEN